MSTEEMINNSDPTGGDEASANNPAPEGAAGGDENTEVSGDQASDATNNESDGEGSGDGGAEVEYSADDFSVPEGMEFDQGMFDAVMPVAKEANISKENMQKLIDVVSTQRADAQDAQLKAWDDTRAEWRNSVRSDNEIGGTEEAVSKTMGVVEKAMNEYGTPELKQFGEQYGWTDHPEFVRMMYRIGLTLGEGANGDIRGNPSNGGKTVADRWYGDQ